MNTRFLLPGTSETYHCGGLTVSLAFADEIRAFHPVEIITYKLREPEYRFLDDIALEPANADDTLWIVTWGPHVSDLLGRLAGRRVLYYAQSAGWHIDMPHGVAIACVTRFLMAYWSQWAPGNPLFLLSPALDPECRNRGGKRDIDLLYLSRKTTPYLHDTLMPLLRERCRVETVDQPIPHHELLDLYNRSKGYIYDFSPTTERLWVDGFGLQPLEAIVCGCMLFSTVSGGPVDYLDPGRNCVQIGMGLERDLRAITSALDAPPIGHSDGKALGITYSRSVRRDRVASLLRALEQWDGRAGEAPRTALMPSPGEAPQLWRETLAKRQQEIAVLRSYIDDQNKLIASQRDGVEWLRGEVTRRDEIISSRDDGIRWLQSELAGSRGAAAGLNPRMPSPPPTRQSAAYRAYSRLLRAYRNSSNGITGEAYKRGFETAIRTAVPLMSHGMRFPSRAIGGFWSIDRWRFEFLAGWNEYESVAACRALIRPGMTVVDVGAHLGYYTRLFSRLVGRSGHVLAFEPEPENFALLGSNAARLRLRNVRLFGTAVSDHSGTETLHLSPGHTNHSLVQGYTPETGAVAVGTSTLDEALAREGITSVDFIKIDVEGAEPRVLAGMRGLLARSPQLNMLVEYNPRALRCGGTEPEALVRTIESLGFTVFAGHPDGTWGRIPADTEIDSVNLLCLRA